MAEPRRVLYRCGTPTNYLCPCGAAARRLKKLGVEYRTERVRRRRSSRPEILELTGLPYVPVLVDGDEVVNDSRRIVQYLDWKYREDTQAGKDQGVQAGTGPKSGERPSTIHTDE